MTPKKLKILHVLSQKPEYTGSGFYLKAMLDQSSTRGHSNFLIAGVTCDEVDQFNSLTGDNSRFVTFAGGDVPFPIVGMSDSMPYESLAFKDLQEEDINLYEEAFSKKLVQAVEDFKPDVIHCHHLWILTSLTRRLFPKIPVVATSHGTGIRQFDKLPSLRKRVLEGCSKLDHIMALSERQRQEISIKYKYPLERITVVGGGYERQRFYEKKKSHTPPIEIMFAGKVSSAKGIPWLSEALCSLKDLPWHLNVVGGGSGEDYKSCLKSIEKLEDRATVHGRLEHHDDVAALMRKCHIFVLPSLFEGLPLVLLEALASGCRLVSTSLPGVNEVLGDIHQGYINLAQLPPTIDNERPVESFEGDFITSLRQALKDQIELSIEEPNIEMDRISETLDRYSWSSVFNRTEKVLISSYLSRSSSL